MTKIVRGIALGALVIASSARAQTPTSFTWSSYLNARKTVDAAVAAIGGVERLQRLTDISRELVGDRMDVGQGPKFIEVPAAYSGLGPARAGLTHPRVTSIRDYATGRSLEHIRDTIYGGQILDVVSVVAPPAPFRYYIDYIDGGMRTSPAPAFVSSRAIAMRRYPEGLLRLMLRTPENLRSLGETKWNGETQSVVATTAEDGAQITAYFDTKTHLPTKVESIIDDPIFGDATTEVVYLDYASVSGLMLPRRIVDRTAGRTLQDMRVASIVVDAHLNDSVFAKPANAPEIPAAIGGPEVRKLSDNTIAVLGADYNSLAINAGDHLIVLEAGANPRYAEAALNAIKRSFPNLPVRYLVSTHWNFDHLGGVRTYVAEGATIITTPSAKRAIEITASASHTMRPDALARTPATPKFEIFTGRRTLGSGASRVELYDISPNPHVDEMIIAYLPAEKLLFEADLLDLEAAGRVGTGGRDTEALLRRIEQLGLDVQEIIPVHGLPATMDDLRAAIAKRTRSASR